MSKRANPERRTSADVVFDALYEQIISLGLMPGTKMSEAEVAEQFSVSRQPVRDAFNRLGNMNLLLIQPQRATVVRKFSMSNIRKARFTRLSVELELTRDAAHLWHDRFAPRFGANLEGQELAVKCNDRATFHRLDAEFHELISQVAQKRFAFEIVKENKMQVDRICILSLKRTDEMSKLVDDHRKIFKALTTGRVDASVSAIREHLTRIENTIETVHETHAEYFDDTADHPEAN